MPEHTFTLRAMQPTDSAAVAALITDFDGDLTTRYVVDTYTAITDGTEDRTIGVVAECSGYDGLVGMGTVRFGSGQYNGQVLPLAGLDGLKVHPGFRGQGLGRQLAEWRIQQIRAAQGDACVIFTGMLRDNHASRAVATKWCREFVEPLPTAIMPTRMYPPKTLRGITVRELEPHEYAEFAAKQNTFFQSYQLYKPITADSIATCTGIAPVGLRVYRYFVALDSAGHCLAGARTWVRGLLKVDTFNHPPPALRIINRLVHLLPKDFVIRDIAVTGFWYEPNQMEIAQHFWDMLRWHCKAYGTTMGISFDARDPTRNAVKLKPWHQPRIEIAYAINGPTPLDRARLLFGLGRV